MNDVLPDEDNVVRYVRPGLVDDGTVDGSAFVLRPGEEALSVNWLECFEGTVSEQVDQVRAHVHLNLRPNGVLARLNVGDGKTAASSGPEGTGIEFASDPQPANPPDYPDPDPSHALVSGLPSGESSAAAAIGDRIRNALTDIHPATVG